MTPDSGASKRVALLSMAFGLFLFVVIVLFSVGRTVNEAARTIVRVGYYKGMFHPENAVDFLLTALFAILPLASITLGLVAIRKAKSSPATHGGRGMATAGVLLSAAAGLIFAYTFIAGLRYWLRVLE
jgi:hypothetical protein